MQALILLPDYQCSTCTASQKIRRGCEEDATHPVIMEGETLLRCPRRILLDQPEWISEIWWLYSNYSDGILPEGGGLSDQPYKLLAVLRLLTSARSAADSEKEEMNNRKRAIASSIAGQ